jgi:hypothetical protein
MKVLKHRTFIDAVALHSGQEREIKALYSFLLATDIQNKKDLLALFPGAVQNNPAEWEISFANGKLFFTGAFCFEGQYVLSESIGATSFKEKITE